MSDLSTHAESIERATAFLRRDMLRHIVPLKVIAAHRQTIRCLYIERGATAGALILLPTQDSPFDRTTYPDSDAIGMLSLQGDPRAAAALLDGIPEGWRVVFKLPGEHEQALIAQRYALQRVTAFLSFTSQPGAGFASWDDVRLSEQLDPRCLDLYAQQGHDRDEMYDMFAGGAALCASIYRDGAPVAACFAFRNFEQIWEVGGLFTLPQARRQGLGRQLVETVLHTLGARSLMPRYVIHENNHASRQLAESVGLRLFVTSTHFRATPAPA